MKSSITVYYGSEQDWLRELLAKHYEQILDEIEGRVRSERIGMPWRPEDRDDPVEPVSMELRAGFEVSYTVGRTHDEEEGPLCSGCSWILHDFWMNEEPPGDGITRGDLRVTWVDLGERLFGDSGDSDDPDDVSVLRFDVHRRDRDADGNALPSWGAIEDASYCTRVPASTDELTRMRLLEYIMDEIYEPASEGRSIKRLCQKLSWIEPRWLKEKTTC